MVSTFILMSFDGSFHFLAAKYLHDLSPYLVVLTLGKDKNTFLAPEIVLKWA